MRYLKFKGILKDKSWIAPGYIGVDEKGIIRYLAPEPPAEGAAVEFVNGLALPGFTNAHSHAFQYAMAGLAEQHPSGTHDDFWTWREAMYACALSVNPDQAEAIAAMVYAEMLQQGYTEVVEFHYLHHDKNGKPYTNLAEMGERMISAAAQTGISITLIPVFYQKGGFGKKPEERQRRFISKTCDDYFDLFTASGKAIRDYAGARAGFSVHSLRAVDLEDVRRTIANGPSGQPFHMHIAEQKKEVTDCLAWCQKKPVQWLLENVPVNERFHLVHATHLDDGELSGIISSGATTVLCPSTEGNLGDGIFRMKEYCNRGGRWTIGTDSHIGLDPLEEFRMIDYRQRLLTNERNTFQGNAAAYMIKEAVRQGRLASGNPDPQNFAVGELLNAAVYDAATPLLGNSSQDNWLSTLVFAAGGARLYGTLSRGQWVVRDGQHRMVEGIKKQFSAAVRQLANR